MAYNAYRLHASPEPSPVPNFANATFWAAGPDVTKVAGKSSEYHFTLHPIPLYLQTRASETTTWSQYFCILRHIIFVDDKFQDLDKYLPRASRLDAIVRQKRMEVGKGSAPENYGTSDGVHTSWRHDVKTKFEYLPDFQLPPMPSRSLYQPLFESKKYQKAMKQLEEWKAEQEKLKNREPYDASVKQPNLVPMTPAEESYNLIVNSHILASGVHQGRDATFKALSLRTTTITKEIVRDFIKRCPGCTKRLEKANEAYQKRGIPDSKKPSRKGKGRAIDLPAQGQLADENEQESVGDQLHGSPGLYNPHLSSVFASWYALQSGKPDLPPASINNMNNACMANNSDFDFTQYGGNGMAMPNASVSNASSSNSSTPDAHYQDHPSPIYFSALLFQDASRHGFRY